MLQFHFFIKKSIMHQQDTINEEYKIISNKYILNNKKSDLKFHVPVEETGLFGLLHHEVG